MATINVLAATWTALDFNTGALKLVQTFASYIGVPVALGFALWGLLKGVVGRQGGGPQWGKVGMSLGVMAFLMNLAWINNLGSLTVTALDQVMQYVEQFKA